MRYAILFAALICTVWGGTFSKGRFLPRCERGFTPEAGYMNIIGFRERLIDDTVNSDYVWAGFDSTGISLYAGDAFLDNQQLPWDGGQYWLDYSQGFRYQSSHRYTFRVTGSASVPCCTVMVTSAGPNFSITTPVPDDTVRQSSGFRVAWQPRGDTIYVQLSDTVNTLVWQMDDTGAVFFTPAALDSLLPGPLWLFVWHENYSESYPGFPFMTWTARCEMMAIELAGVSVAEWNDARCTVHDTGLKVKPNPFRERCDIRYTMHDTRYRKDKASLNIYDATGRLVKSFSPGSMLSAPCSMIASWDGRDDSGIAVPAGVYFLKSENRDIKPARIVKIK